MKLASKLWMSLQDTELKLWHMIAAFLFTNLFTLYTTQNEKYYDLLSERSQELTLVSSDFESIVSNFINSGDELVTLTPESLHDLKSNIDKQISALNRLQVVVTEEQSEALSPYYTDLADMRDIIADGVQSNDVSLFGELALRISKRKTQLLRDVAL